VGEYGKCGKARPPVVNLHSVADSAAPPSVLRITPDIWDQIPMPEVERERERQTETETERERERQTDRKRKTDRQRQTDRQREREIPQR